MVSVLDLCTIEWFEHRLAEGQHLTGMAKEVGVTLATLLEWINRDPNRRAQFSEARRRTAQMWEERAEKVLLEAKGKDELYKARELAHHYRWRASKIAPREYGVHVTQEVTSPDGSMSPAGAVDLSKLPDDVIKALMDARTND